MAYSELIKDFERIRDYMRQFYVYGFKNRSEYDRKSSRSYDNERRRMESWLGEYMSFRQDAAGKNVFLSVDSRRIARNPLYKAFKAKSFTDKDITLHFYILDILADGCAKTVGEIVTDMTENYLTHFNSEFSFDESTVRKKLKEYERLGLLQCKKEGREVFYARTDDETIKLDSWADAISFFAEESPVGVVGSYLADRMEETPDTFRFKHHYMLHALDSDVLCDLLVAINEHRAVELTLRSLRNDRDYVRTACPIKIYISTQTGRQYLLGYQYRERHMVFYRLDTIQKVTVGNIEQKYDIYLGYQKKFDKNLWGVSTGVELSLDHIEMTIQFAPGEEYILQRLEREKRHGEVEIIGEHSCRFTADVYDATEMLPWLRTFIGRVTDLQCSNQSVVNTFYRDLAQMAQMYGGETDAIQ